MLPEMNFEIVKVKDDKNIRLCRTCGYPLDEDEMIICEVCKEDKRKDWD
jgi:recombinational DNA repair protein RecR